MSRYYDPTLKRFINADGLTATGQGIIGNNMFAYCLNNPANCADGAGSRCVAVSEMPGGGKPKNREFNTEEEATIAFYTEYMNQSLYSRHEFATEIYTKTVNGATKYYYNIPHVGGPHEVYGPHPTPYGTTLVAIAHTHTNPGAFSGADTITAGMNRVSIYLMSPEEDGLRLLRHDPLTGKTEHEFERMKGFSPTPLTALQKSTLVSLYSSSWDAHIQGHGDCGFNCGAKRWPAW